MPLPSPDNSPDPTDPDPADELDDPYVQTILAEEFVEAVETASREADGEDA
ncbi:hypothetical protein A6C57_27220 (plasmid) [Fibrella sp. ES10-3-2-2]